MLFLLALPICISDLASFRVPNIYIKFLLYPAATTLVFFGLPDKNTLVISSVLVVSLFVLGTGMGDLKLLSLIFITCSIAPIQYMFIVFTIAVAHIVISTAVNRSIPIKIALAPSIFLVLATYLATR
jgi:Flp pilus assembly protein protease CpaA